VELKDDANFNKLQMEDLSKRQKREHRWHRFDRL